MRAIENSGMALSSMNGYDELLSHPQVALELLKLDQKNVVVVNGQQAGTTSMIVTVPITVIACVLCFAIFLNYFA